jgi:hypothetical protein
MNFTKAEVRSDKPSMITIFETSTSIHYLLFCERAYNKKDYESSLAYNFKTILRIW